MKWPAKRGSCRLINHRIIGSALAIACVSFALQPGLHAQSSAATFGQVIALGATPSDIVLDESRSRAYLVNTSNSRIDIFSTTSNAVTGSITVGTNPLAAAISPDKAFLYVTNAGTTNTPTTWSVSVIDLTAGAVVQTAAMPAQPQGVAVGADGRALISTLGTTSGTTTVNTLLIFDKTQPSASQLTAVVTPPPPSTPTGVAPATLPKPPTTFLSKLTPTPNGQYIVGFTNTTTLTYMFVYEVSSGSILRSRTVNGQSTVLSMSPDGSRFMAGLTMFDIATLAILGQMNNATAPFAFSSAFNTVANTGGSVFSPDGKSLYAAFNVTAASNPPAPANSSTLLIANPNHLGIQTGIRMPESIFAKMVITADGSNAWSLSQSGLIYLPLSTLASKPILAVNTTAVFLSSNPCNPGLAQATINVSNAGAGKLTYAVTTISNALTSSVSSGVAPSALTFTMEPGRLTTVTRYPGTNLVSMTAPTATIQGQAFDVSLASAEAVNIPPVVRVYMNYRNADQRGLVFPIQTTPNNSPIANNITGACGTAAATTCTAVVDGDMGLQDLVLDKTRNRIYISNAGYNRIEVFDTSNQAFLSPIVVGPLPGQMALSTDSNTLYVATLGSELIHKIDLTISQDVGVINFPPLPRQTGGTSTTTSSPLVYPQALAVGLNGLEFVMSDGHQWRVVGGTALPRPIDPIVTTSTTSNAFTVSTTTRVNMIPSADNSKILVLAGSGTTGTGYLYDATADQYVANALLFGGSANGNAIQGFYGPLGVGPSQAYYTLGGLFTNASLTQLGGTANASTAAAGSPALRNVVATAPYDANNFLRLSTPVRATAITTLPTTDSRPTLELVNIATGATTPLAVAPDNPRFTILGTTRFNVPPRSMVIDSNNVAYIIGVSGLSVVPLTPGGATAPQILSRNGVLNTSGGPTLNVGGFINVSGTNLASSAKANSLTPPTILGGSCVTFNSVPVPLLQTSAGQIVAQIPTTVNPGANVVQVRSLGTGLQSSPVVVAVSAATGTTAGTGANASQGVAGTISNGRIGLK